MNGIILLDKCQGVTSFTACNAVKRITGSRRAGHSGTLDPMATGVLPVFLGSATRFIELIPDKDKAYEARFVTGKKTDTLDITGTVTEVTGREASLDDILGVLPNFKGAILQTPPMYSAIRKDGIRLYDLARKGVEVEREQRAVTVYDINVQNDEYGQFAISISCSSGTYVRSIISDIGDMLGCGAVMTALRRTCANGFDLADCRTADELTRLSSENRLSEALVALDRVLSAYPAVTVSDAQSKRFGNGGELFLDRVDTENNDGYYRVYSPDNLFIGIGEVCRDKNILAVKRIFNSEY